MADGQPTWEQIHNILGVCQQWVEPLLVDFPDPNRSPYPVRDHRLNVITKEYLTHFGIPADGAAKEEIHEKIRLWAECGKIPQPPGARARKPTQKQFSYPAPPKPKRPQQPRGRGSGLPREPSASVQLPRTASEPLLNIVTYTEKAPKAPIVKKHTSSTSLGPSTSRYVESPERRGVGRPALVPPDRRLRAEVRVRAKAGASVDELRTAFKLKKEMVERAIKNRPQFRGEEADNLDEDKHYFKLIYDKDGKPAPIHHNPVQINLGKKRKRVEQVEDPRYVKRKKVEQVDSRASARQNTRYKKPVPRQLQGLRQTSHRPRPHTNAEILLAQGWKRGMKTISLHARPSRELSEPPLVPTWHEEMARMDVVLPPVCARLEKLSARREPDNLMPDNLQTALNTIANSSLFLLARFATTQSAEQAFTFEALTQMSDKLHNIRPFLLACGINDEDTLRDFATVPETRRNMLYRQAVNRGWGELCDWYLFDDRLRAAMSS